MKKFKYIFVILTYRNTEDINELLQSIGEKADDYKVIIVNSFFDDASKLELEQIAKKHECVFINIPNKGYSFGNNRGIEYALNNFSFDFLIVANPDTVIEKFDIKSINKDDALIVGPQIINLNGKLQNPLVPRKNKFSQKIIYVSFIKESKILLRVGTAINRISRELFLVFNRMKLRSNYVYALHGSFLIFTQNALLQLGVPYDENLFLFAEESVLAEKAKKIGIRSCVTDEVVVKHKEDGSMKFESEKVYSNLKNANIYFYKHYCQFNHCEEEET